MVESNSVLHSEIFEQPAVIRRLLDSEAERVAEIGRQLSGRPIRFVMIAARGTSDNAARYGQYLFGVINRLPVALASPSLITKYASPPRMEDALVIGVSQSGQSPDIVGVLTEARHQGAPTLAITNDPGSPLATAAEHLIPLHAGQERSVAATKTYTAQLAALAMLALSLAERPINALAPIPDLMSEALESEPQARAAAQALADSNRGVVLGRGFNYATAHEIALKIKELAAVEAEPYSFADFKHGPIAMVDSGFPVILITMGDIFREELGDLASALRAQGARLVVFSDSDADRALSNLFVPLPSGLPEWLTPLVAAPPGQLLAFHLARAHGFDPDQPRVIHKVTLTH
jgi:glucosamine--fructose-6-phosphate aminotransferase (isomerizing)